ncbi:endonuclease domain-containing protein [Streptomyces sp. NPDC020794]|uniref:endonuclease domain-containing protein n=1 Tax=unclassified Streptomyces TaxID=2593676 RepID=UPI0036E42455
MPVNESGFDSGIFAVDHCHGTGVVRGALCQACNFMLGNARDSVETLLAAVKYLTKDHSVEPWNRGKSRTEETRERRELMLASRLERAEEALRAAETRVKELETIISEVDEETAFAARRRARDADAIDRFITEVISVVPQDAPPVAAIEIRKAWMLWSGGVNCPVQSLYEALQKLGGIQRRTKRGSQWLRIALVSQSEVEAVTAQTAE